MILSGIGSVGANIKVGFQKSRAGRQVNIPDRDGNSVHPGHETSLWSVGCLALG